MRGDQAASTPARTPKRRAADSRPLRR